MHKSQHRPNASTRIIKKEVLSKNKASLTKMNFGPPNNPLDNHTSVGNYHCSRCP